MALAYLFMCAVFGTTYLAIKIGLNEGIPPFYMAALRFLIASVLLLVYLYAKRIPFPKTFKEYVEIAFLGVLMISAPFAALFWAEQYITSGTASLLVATAPVFIGLLSKMEKAQWVGFGLALAGLYFIVFPEIHAGQATFHSLMAKGAIVAAEIFFAYGAIRSKAVLSSGVTPLMFNGLQMGFASIVLLAISGIAEYPLAAKWSNDALISLLYLSVVASVAASGIYYWLVKITSPLFPSTWTYVAPIIAMFAGSLFLGERLSTAGVFGAVLVIGGVVLVNRKIFISMLQAYSHKWKKELLDQ